MTLNGSFLRNLWVIIYTIVRFATTAPPSVQRLSRLTQPRLWQPPPLAPALCATCHHADPSGCAVPQTMNAAVVYGTWRAGGWLIRFASKLLAARVAGIA